METIIVHSLYTIILLIAIYIIGLFGLISVKIYPEDKNTSLTIGAIGLIAGMWGIIFVVYSLISNG